MTDTSSRWLVHFADRDPLEVTCSPAADLAHLLRTYADAIAAEPIAELVQTCGRCEHLARPGLIDDGYCDGARPGLTLAYGYLHVLPADRGADCAEFSEVAL